MAQQNQSPVVTDEELIANLRRGWVWGEHGTFQDPDVEPLEAIMRQAAERLEAALPSGVRVKALSFKDRGHNNGDRYCNTEVGQYAIGNIHGTIMVILRRVRDGQDDDSIIWEGDDWAEAEKAACDDHASRILSAIEPAPFPSHAETVAPYAAALRMIRDAVGELFGPVSDLESEEAVLLRGPQPHHEAEAIIAGLERVKAQNGRLEKSLQEAHEISERYREMYATKSNEKVDEFRRASAAEAILRSIAGRPALMKALDIETADAINSALHPEREG